MEMLWRRFTVNLTALHVITFNLLYVGKDERVKVHQILMVLILWIYYDFSSQSSSYIDSGMGKRQELQDCERVLQR